MAAPIHRYETFIRATPAEVWTAITDPEFTKRYFHNTAFTTDLEPGSAHRYVLANGADAVEGVVEVVEPNRRLVITWHVLYDTAMAEEPPGRVEWVLAPANDDESVTRVTLRHFDLGKSPLTSDNVALGWVGVLDSMKTLLETGEALGELNIEPVERSAAADRDIAEHRRRGITAHGETWELLMQAERDEAATFELLARAHASAYHWYRSTEDEAVQRARAAWLLARCYTVAGQSDLANRYAASCATLTASASGTADFDHAYAHEARARAHALAGRLDAAADERAKAMSVAISDVEDDKIVKADLAEGPWFGLDD